MRTAAGMWRHHFQSDLCFACLYVAGEAVVLKVSILDPVDFVDSVP